MIISSAWLLTHLLATLKRVYKGFLSNEGIRLPGIWNMFEAGIRAILGQQISVVAARNLVEKLVHELGEPIGEHKLFPTPKAIAESDLAFFKMPLSRKQTLQNLANHYLACENADYPEQWLKPLALSSFLTQQHHLSPFLLTRFQWPLNLSSVQQNEKGRKLTDISYFHIASLATQYNHLNEYPSENDLEQNKYDQTTLFLRAWQ